MTDKMPVIVVAALVLVLGSSCTAGENGPPPEPSQQESTPAEGQAEADNAATVETTVTSPAVEPDGPSYQYLPVPIAEIPEGAESQLWEADDDPQADIFRYLPEACHFAWHMNLDVLKLQTVHAVWQFVFQHFDPRVFDDTNLAFLDSVFTPFLEATESCAFGLGETGSTLVCQGDYSESGWRLGDPEVELGVLEGVPGSHYYGQGLFVLDDRHIVLRGRGEVREAPFVPHLLPSSANRTAGRVTVLGRHLDPSLAFHLLDAGERRVPFGFLSSAQERARLIELTGQISEEGHLSQHFSAVYSEPEVAEQVVGLFASFARDNADSGGGEFLLELSSNLSASGSVVSAPVSLHVTSMMVATSLANRVGNRLIAIHIREGQALLLELSRAVGQAASQGIQESLPSTPAMTPCLSAPNRTQSMWHDNGWETLGFSPESVRFAYSVTWEGTQVTVAARSRRSCDHPATFEITLAGRLDDELVWEPTTLTRDTSADFPEPTAPRFGDR